MKAVCTLCKWTGRAAGVYKTLALARAHMQAEHPLEFELVTTHEECVREAQRQMVKKFGQAVKPLKLN